MHFLTFLCIFAFNANSFNITKGVKSLVDEYFLPDDSVKAKLVDRSWEIVYKNLMPLDTDFVYGEKTIAIEDDSQNPWGVECPFRYKATLPFTIAYIHPDKQFEDLGITIGWKITKINDVVLSETNAEEYRNLMKRGDACTITFKSDDSNFALLQHKKSKELLLKSLNKDDAYEDYITTVQISLEQKQWLQAYAPWHFLPNFRRRFRMESQKKLPKNLHKILQHNLVDFIKVNGRMHRDHHDTPLGDAVIERDVVLAKKLISRGAKVNADAMRSAVYGESVECTQLLLDVNSNAVNERDRCNDTPLFFALGGPIDQIKCALLLLKFTNLNTKDEDGDTALEKAKLWNQKEYVKILTLAKLVQKSIKKECLQKFRQNN